MGPLEFADLPEQALLLIDSAPIIYFLEGHPKFGPRFRPISEAHAAGRLRFAVTTITIAEVLTGPLQAPDDALARRYRSILETRQPIGLDVDIAENAARLRASLRLKLEMPFKQRVHSRSTPPRLWRMTAISRACTRCA